MADSEPSLQDTEDKIWCEEGCMMLHMIILPNGSLQFRLMDTSKGHPGKIVSIATIAQFRLKRIAHLLELARNK